MVMEESLDDIPKERINLILKTVFELLWFEMEGLYVSEIVKYLKNTIALTEFEKGFYPAMPYVPRYELIVRIGTIPLEKAGWLVKTKNGRWFITTSGRNACNKYKSSQDFFEASIQILLQWKSRENERLTFYNKDLYDSAKKLSVSEIKQYLEILDIYDIRIIVSSLMKALGCYITWRVSQKDEHNPVDFICSKDPIGIQPPRVLVHIAKVTEKCTSINIDEFAKHLEPDDIGMFFSFGGFSIGTEEYALELRQPRINTFDLDRFITIWLENREKINPEGLAKLPLNPVFFLAVPSYLNRSAEFENQQDKLLE